MKRLTIIWAIIAILYLCVAVFFLRGSAQASYYPIYGGSFHPLEGDWTYVVEWSNKIPLTPYNVTIESDPGIWVDFHDDPFMAFVDGIIERNNLQYLGVMDYMMGDLYFWDPVQVPITAAATPIPPSVVLLVTGLIGLAGFRRKAKWNR